VRTRHEILELGPLRCMAVECVHHEICAIARSERAPDKPFEPITIGRVKLPSRKLVLCCCDYEVSIE